MCPAEVGCHTTAGLRTCFVAAAAVGAVAADIVAEGRNRTRREGAPGMWRAPGKFVGRVEALTGHMRSPKIVQVGPHIAVSRTGPEEAQRTPDHEQLQWEQIPGKGKTAKTGSPPGVREEAPRRCPVRDLRNPHHIAKVEEARSVAVVTWSRVCQCDLADIPAGTAVAAGSRMERAGMGAAAADVDAG